MNNNKTKLLIMVVPICAILLSLGTAYAWYVWRTSSNDETIIATDVGYAKVFFDGGSDVTGKLKPVSDKSKGMSKTITVSADKPFIEPITFNLYLDINSLDEGLKHESFKFELYKDGNLVKAGNFSNKYLNSALSECSKNEGVSHITLTSDIVTTTESVYTLYTWIDGTLENPLEMEGKNFDFTLHASGEHAILGETPIIPEGAIYIRGAIPGTPNNHDMTNATVYNAGDHFPLSPQKGDIYQYGDYEYIYGYYLENTFYNINSAPSGISYNTNDVYVSNLAETNEQNQYQNNVEFIAIIGGYHVKWISADGHFEDSDGWGVAIADIADYRTKIVNVEILATINGANVINLSGTFSDTVLDLSEIIIPETIKYMNYTFVGYSDWNESNNNIFRINSKEISRIENIFGENGGYNTTIEVPEGSTTYNTFMNAKANGEISENVTITTFIKE